MVMRLIWARSQLPPPFRGSSRIFSFNQVGYQAAPTGLMHCPQSLAGFAMIIFVEQAEILPMRIVLERAVGGMSRNYSLGITAEEVNQALDKQVHGFVQIHLPVFCSRQRHLEVGP